MVEYLQNPNTGELNPFDKGRKHELGQLALWVQQLSLNDEITQYTFLQLTKYVRDRNREIDDE